MKPQSAFRLVVKGTGLHRVIDGVDSAVGVYATVFVTETDEIRARAIALDELRGRLTEKAAATERTRLEIESIEPIRADHVPKVASGLSFYRE